jgi:hypothetical protein
MLANSESTFDEVIIQSEELEEKYSIAQQQTQIKDIQLRIQHVSRLIQVHIFSFILINYFEILFRKQRNILIKYIAKNSNVKIFLIN